MALPASRLWSTAYGIVALPVFGVLLVIASVLALLVPGLALRRRLVRVLRATGALGARSADRRSGARITCRTAPASSWPTTRATWTAWFSRPYCRRASRSSSSARPRALSGRGVAAAADRLGVRRPRQPRRPPERCATRRASRGGGPFARVLSRGHICRGTGAAPISHRRIRSRSARAAAGSCRW